jgi:hypothetical protein
MDQFSTFYWKKKKKKKKKLIMSSLEPLWSAKLLIHKDGSGAATRNSSETSIKHKMLRIEPPALSSF